MRGRRLGALLTLLRQRKGYSQMETAQQLCELSGQITVTRHEVSRWEREDRLPSEFWLGWLSKVLEVPMAELEEARARAKGAETMAGNETKKPEQTVGTKWRDYARSVRERSLALVTLKFEHRATSVQLNGTYEEPEQATAAIGMFRRMVTPATAARSTDEASAGAEASTGGNGRRSSPARSNGTGRTVGKSGSGSTPAGAGSQASAASAKKATVPAPGTSAAAPVPSVSGSQQARRPGTVPSGVRRSEAAAAGTPVRVPMGIRYTEGPGVANDNGTARS